MLLSCHGVICSLNPAIIARLQTLYIIINVLYVSHNLSYSTSSMLIPIFQGFVWQLS